ncbi:hypothetical protein MATL_G00067860 [Megalops atlanticus]|uniref:EGF-like domain-containing protein n=1 Tax=Megalops atlanticus TaxID=7932 RepID=A0A9D3QCN3_MEGAT|nr:hypothetical protein MATL_G00067860 [Megalops atlanticus]
MRNMDYFSLSLLHVVCWLVSGNALETTDLTLVNPEPMGTSYDSSLHCVSGDWSTSALPSMGQDFPLHLDNLTVTQDREYRLASKISWKQQDVDVFGAFYCRMKNADPTSNVYTFKMLSEAAFHPESLTITSSIGENVNISFTRKKTVAEDANIFKNGSFMHSVPSYEISETVSYPIHSVEMEDSGVYTVRYMSAAISTSAITRLIVRKCPAGSWGPDCSRTCPLCVNGGVCHDDTGECLCPPGFRGQTCEIACGQGKFGRSCGEKCKDGLCRSMVFCLRDPYGCSCATGWRGLNCSEACPQGYYGAGCKLRCDCSGRGRCDPYRGCVCRGRHGTRCEHEDLPSPTGVRLVSVNQTCLSLSWDAVTGPSRRTGPTRWSAYRALSPGIP